MVGVELMESSNDGLTLNSLVRGKTPLASTLKQPFHNRKPFDRKPFDRKPFDRKPFDRRQMNCILEVSIPNA
jgi:hypothetical protein